MEQQKPKAKKPQEDPLSKTLKLKTPPSSTPSAPKPAVQNPTPPPTSTSLQAPPGRPENAEVPPKEGGEEGERTEIRAPSATVAALGPSAGPAADLQKKLRRAERFGVPVQLSEEEKRKSRAERFGTASTLHGAKDGGNLEEQKRKRRAERFGLALHSVTDEEAKKRARLERFAQNSKRRTWEEEKMKARADRFSQTSIVPSEANGKANNEMKARSVATT